MRFFFFFSLLLAAGPVAAQAEPADSRRPPLFVLEDADSRVYLLGSVHVLPEGALPLPAAVEAAYADAEVVAFELDLDLLAAYAPALLQAATDEASTADLLDADQKAAFDAYVDTLGLPVGALDAFEPWMASVVLAGLTVERAGLTGEGVDAHFFARAGTDAKARVAFETPAFQAALFDDLSDADQIALLLAALADGPDAATALLHALVGAWASGDDARLATLLHDEMAETPPLYEALLTRRNQAWVPQIEALLARSGEDALVVVGAGHLVGAGSVVDLLRTRGHTVARQ